MTESLFELCKKGDCEEVERAVKRDPKAINDFNEDGLTPIMIAAQNKNGGINLVRRLLPLGADPSARAAHSASAMRGYTAMHLASKSGDVDVMQALFDAGASVKAQGQDGWTPLHTAAFSGKVESLKWLVSKKADPNQANEHGITPLCFCANHGRLEAVRTLIKAGAKLDPQDANGDTVYHHAMHVQMFKLFEEDYKFPEVQIDIAVVLAIFGANLDVTNKDGWTPCHWVEEAFGGPEFKRTLKLLSMNSTLLQAAEGSLTTNWNFMTLLSIKNRKVFENLGIDPQQAKDLVDSFQQFEQERQKKKKEDENNPQGPCPFIPANKKKKSKKNTNPLQIVDDEPEQGSESHPGHDREEAERLRSEGKDPSNGACPFFTAPPEVPEQGMDQQDVEAESAVEPPPLPPPSADNGSAGAVDTDPAAAPPTSAWPQGYQPQAPNAAYPPPPYAWPQPPAAAASVAVTDGPPELNWQWVYDNRTAILCCVIAFLLGMWWERKMA